MSDPNEEWTLLQRVEMMQQNLETNSLGIRLPEVDELVSAYAEARSDLAEAGAVLNAHGQALPQLVAELHMLRAKVKEVRTATLEEAAKVVESCIGCITEPLQECAKDGDNAAQFFGKMHAEQIRALAAPTEGTPT